MSKGSERPENGSNHFRDSDNGHEHQNVVKNAIHDDKEVGAEQLVTDSFLKMVLETLEFNRANLA